MQKLLSKCLNTIPNINFKFQYAKNKLEYGLDVRICQKPSVMVLILKSGAIDL